MKIRIFMITLAIMHVAVSFFVVRGRWVELDGRSKREFDKQVAITATYSTDRLESYGDLLYSIRGLFSASELVEATEWEAFVTSLSAFTRYPGVQSIQFTSRSNSAWRIEYVSTREETGSVSQIVSAESDREDIQKAVDLGTPVISEGKNSESGKFQQSIHLGIYKNRETIDTMEEKNAHMLGVVTMVVDTNTLVRDIFERYNLGVDAIAISIVDITNPGIENIIYQGRREAQTEKWKQSKLFSLGGRLYRMEFRSIGNYGILESRDVFLLATFLFFSLTGILLLAGINSRIIERVPFRVRR